MTFFNRNQSGVSILAVRHIIISICIAIQFWYGEAFGESLNFIADTVVREYNGLKVPASGDTKQLEVNNPKIASLSLKPSAGTWDWSQFEYVDVRASNETDHLIILNGYVADKDSTKSEGFVWGEVKLQPHSQGTLTIPLVRRPETPKPFGKPKYKGLTDKVKVAVGTIQANAIGELKIILSGANLNDRVQLQSIELNGHSERASVPFFPFVDTFGQYIHREWSGKIHDPSELIEQRDTEVATLKAMGDVSTYDRFGGWASGPKLNATGHFRVEKRDQRWWLVTPDGTLFFSFGVVGVRSTESGIVSGRETWFKDLPDRKQFADAYLKPTSGLGDYDPNTTEAISFLRANLMRKYGPNWRNESANLARLRLRKYGFNTMGNWSERTYFLGGNTSYTVDVTPLCTMLRKGWNKFPDVFAPDYEAALDQAMKVASDKTCNDPFNVGYFIDNELGWGTSGRGLAEVALNAPVDQPAKIILIGDLKRKYDRIDRLNDAWDANFQSWESMLSQQDSPVKDPTPSKIADLSEFQSKMAQRYFQLSQCIVRKYAPEKLYLGCRMANYCGFYPDLMKQAATYCDVVSFNIYRWAPEADEFANTFDKPIIIGEFGYWPNGVTPFNSVGGPGTFPNRGKAMKDYVYGVLKRPNFVGCHLYLYADQVVSGRGDGESQPTGLVTVTDQPKPDLFNAAREIADHLYAILSGDISQDKSLIPASNPASQRQ